ncbi:thermonuclease family protein [Brevibacterium casei]|uniref:thermonuclease family protein n=1 Tax=Brevibacterium casei TaxID=33889 RepID=UPI001595FB9D|nr:thermonuclease family protein [Brevibacterium casei]
MFTLMAAALTATGCTVAGRSAGGGPDSVGDPRPAVVQYVVDGDTIDVDVDGQEQRVRLLGIDTPEIATVDRPGEPCGDEARQLMQELIVAGDVTLRSDDAQPAEDKYGRTLAYVEADGKDLGAELLAAGLAEVYQAAPDIARFAEYEQIRENAPQPECAR